MPTPDPDDIKQIVSDAISESDDINEEDVVVGEPMSVSEFSQLLHEMNNQYNDDTES